jgi:RsiW-degrading membrane proteinase PrsW (M82 family)
MRNALNNLLGLNPQNMPMAVFVVCLLAWLLVLGATLWSIYDKERRPMAAKVLWTLLVIGLPMVGVLVYALYSVTQVENLLLQGATTPNKKKSGTAKTGKELTEATG